MGTVLITGTSVGIGLAAAVEIARRGERVFASMRDPSRSAELEAAALAAGVELEIIQLDVTNSASVESAVALVNARAGHIDVVVNNAAFATQGPIEFTTEEEVQTTLDTNVAGPIRLTRAVLPSMRARGRGRIVNVSSPAAYPRIGLRLWGIYSASKAALSSLTLELCKELAPLGIEVVLLEAVGGKSRMNAEANKRAATVDPKSSPYAAAEEIFRVHWTPKPGAPTREPSQTAQYIADACTMENPPLRYPAEAHASWDGFSRLSDEHFLRLAALDPSPEIYEGAHTFWEANSSARGAEPHDGDA